MDEIINIGMIVCISLFLIVMGILIIGPSEPKDDDEDNNDDKK